MYILTPCSPRAHGWRGEGNTPSTELERSVRLRGGGGMLRMQVGALHPFTQVRPAGRRRRSHATSAAAPLGDAAHGTKRLASRRTRHKSRSECEARALVPVAHTLLVKWHSTAFDGLGGATILANDSEVDLEMVCRSGGKNHQGDVVVTTSVKRASSRAVLGEQGDTISCD
jgi:hypothetical protein